MFSDGIKGMAGGLKHSKDKHRRASDRQPTADFRRKQKHFDEFRFPAPNKHDDLSNAMCAVSMQNTLLRIVYNILFTRTPLLCIIV